MNKAVRYALAILIPLSLPASPVFAQQDDEVTIDVVSDQDAMPEEVTSEIQLPEAASDQARESADDGLDAANSARENRREFGRDKASEARETREGNAVSNDGGTPAANGPPAGKP